MKRKVLAMITVIAVLTSGMTVFASNPSATGSDVTIVPDTYEGEEVSGYIVAADGTIIEGIAVDGTDSWIEVTDYSDSDTLSEESQEMLDNATTQLASIDSVTDIVDVDTIPEDFDYENAEVALIFDVDASDDIKAYLEANPGTTLSITVYVGVEADDNVLVLHNYEADLWEVLDSTNNGDGSITISIGASGFSPVAIYVETSSGSTGDSSDDSTDDESVKTGDDTNIIGLLVVALVALVGAGAMIVVRRRKADEK